MNLRTELSNMVEKMNLRTELSNMVWDDLKDVIDVIIRIYLLVVVGITIGVQPSTIQQISQMHQFVQIWQLPYISVGYYIVYVFVSALIRRQ